MAKKKSSSYEPDHFISSTSLFCKMFLGFLGLAILATAAVLVGYYFGFLDAVKKVDINDPDVAPEPVPGEYLIGVGRYDVTGPVAQVNMMGYANPSQTASGLHQRLYSRTFIVCNNGNTSCVVFATVDSGMASQVVKLEVIKRLKAKYGPTRYTERNVVISGTHSHSGPAGFFQTMLVEVTSLGAIKQSTDSFIDGIVKSIEQAHSNLRLGNMHIGTDEVVEGNINRSPSAYLKNPLNERERYRYNTEHNMTMLKFQATNGDPIGMFTWYPVHCTSMNFSNELISSDNKGRASALFEKMMRKSGENKAGNESFVGAFASANLGDVSPRTKGPICVDTGKSCDFEKSTCNIPPRVKNCVAFGPGVDMFDSTDIIAKRQLETAKILFHNKTKEQLQGPVSWVHQYVDMTKQPVQLDDGSNVTTCKPGMGYSFAAGTTDGAGAFNFVQSMTTGTLLWDTVRDDIIVKVVCSEAPPQEYYDCHHPKPVLLPTGYMDRPYAWHPTIVDVQMLRLGQLIIIAVPGEFTTMAGRRIKESVQKEAQAHGVANAKVVLAGLSNVYTHYITTPEEYTAQRYEGASTIYGPHTFQAYQQKYTSLVGDLVTGNHESVDPGPSPSDTINEQIELLPPPKPDSAPDGKSIGDVMNDVNGTFRAGDEVSVTFYGANPRHNMKLGSSYLAVQQQLSNGSQWQDVFVDTDWETRFIWNDATTKASDDVTIAKDKNVITALFDVISATAGVHFDYEEAMMLHERGDLPLPESLRDVISDVRVRRRLVNNLHLSGVLRWEKYQPISSFGSAESHVTIVWNVPVDQPSGTYRISYYGDTLTLSGQVVPFQGYSSSFRVQ
ncbi:putative neutral ceramidase C [Ciona intestinalis]